ncbi:ABC transporter ATP-binding protein [Planctomycetota bacterium]
MIKLEGVNKIFHSRDGQINALSHIDLEIAKGQFVIIRGPSGCGKTTLLMTMAGILGPTSGSVRIDGNDLYATGIAKRNKFRAQYFGFVFQMFHLVPYLNVVDNVTLAGPAAANKADKARARDILETLGMSERIRHTPPQLSSGEKQRVAMARALFNDPPILIADEPTGNLDTENAAIVHDRLSKYHQLGGTVVLVTHDSNTNLQVNREIQMKKGQIA